MWRGAPVHTHQVWKKWHLALALGQPLAGDGANRRSGFKHHLLVIIGGTGFRGFRGAESVSIDTDRENRLKHQQLAARRVK